MPDDERTLPLALPDPNAEGIEDPGFGLMLAIFRHYPGSRTAPHMLP